MDPLADVLRSVRLSGGVFLDARFTEPWSVLANLTAEDCRAFFANPTQLIAYHFVIEGHLHLGIPGEPSIEIHAGEIVLLTRNDPHTMGSAPGLKPVNAATLIQPAESSGLARIIHGGGGPETHIVCGYLGSEEGYNPLIAALPSALKLDVRQSMSRDWIEASVRFAAAEFADGKLASSSVMSRLSETLLVEAVRQYALRLPDGDCGWLKGFSDPQIGRALALIHREIAAPWSADALARGVGMSRSAFIDRFRNIVGLPPIRYLTVWRLQMARQQLRETPKSIAQIARSVGYDSEEAFSRAFKREFGMPPARWRDQTA